MSVKKRSWIGVDLDGTLAEYHGWQGIDHIGKPIPAMVDLVKKMLDAGDDVRIFTARICPEQPEADIDTALRSITHWCFANIGRQLPITCVKDFGMLKLFDDRCVSVIMNTGEIVPLDAVQEVRNLRRELREQAADYENRLVEHRAWLKKATEEAGELRAGLFAANVRIEELRAVLLEVLPLIDGTRQSAMDFPIVAAKVRKAVEGN